MIRGNGVRERRQERREKRGIHEGKYEKVGVREREKARWKRKQVRRETKGVPYSA